MTTSFSIYRMIHLQLFPDFQYKWQFIVFFSITMADEKNCSPSKSALNTSHADEINSDSEKSNSLSNSCDSRLSSENVCFGEEKHLACKNQVANSDADVDSNEPSVKAITTSRNGVSDVCSNKIGSILRPSAFAGGSDTGHSADCNTVESQPAIKCPLKSPKLNLTPSRLGSADNSSLSNQEFKLPFQDLKNPFSKAVSFENDKKESLPTKNNVLQTESNICGGGTGEKQSEPFLSFSSTKPIGVLNNANPSMLTTNFVFGQNLHERVADGIAIANNSEKNEVKAASNNGTSDMLFTSVLTSKEIKDNLNDESGNSSREPFSLIEDAARCEEARANKRKYEEVLVTTGEEDEDNILQVNVKLFAFDSGTWIERGRGTLRLNDKMCEGTVVSRIVIRTLGSLRVVLNTKIWSGMSLSKASDRSIRLTAMDPNGQLKIFLIQASPKDVSTLFWYLDIRLKRCQESEEEPERKKLGIVFNDGKDGEKSENE